MDENSGKNNNWKFVSDTIMGKTSQNDQFQGLLSELKGQKKVRGLIRAQLNSNKQVDHSSIDNMLQKSAQASQVDSQLVGHYAQSTGKRDSMKAAIKIANSKVSMQNIHYDLFKKKMVNGMKSPKKGFLERKMTMYREKQKLQRKQTIVKSKVFDGYDFSKNSSIGSISDNSTEEQKHPSRVLKLPIKRFSTIKSLK